jgi:hypothetical protein
VLCKLTSCRVFNETSFVGFVSSSDYGQIGSWGWGVENNGAHSLSAHALRISHTPWCWWTLGRVLSSERLLVAFQASSPGAPGRCSYRSFSGKIKHPDCAACPRTGSACESLLPCLPLMFFTKKELPLTHPGLITVASGREEHAYARVHMSVCTFF